MIKNKEFNSMNDIKKYIKNKKDFAKYKFEVHAPDGAHDIYYDNLDDFEKDWFNGKTPSPNPEGMTTNDGRRLYTSNGVTRDAMKLRFTKNIALNSLNLYNDAEEILKIALGLKKDDVAKLIAIKQLDLKVKYIETNVGRVFLIKDNKEHHDIVAPRDKSVEKAGFPKGSMSLQDTISICDNLEGYILIADIRNEAVNVEDILGRSLSKNQVIVVHDEYTDESRMEENIYRNIVALDQLIIGDTGTLNNIHNDIVNMKNNSKFGYSEGFDISKAGFSNSKDNPASGYEISKVIENINPDNIIFATKGLSEDEGNKSSIEAIKISQLFSYTVGSTEKGFYMEDDKGDVSFIDNGAHMKRDFDGAPYKLGLTLISEEKLKTLKVIPESDVRKYSPF